MPKRTLSRTLYSPKNEHDACGVGFVAHLKGKKSQNIIEQGLMILKNLDHRGAVGADPLMGDGAGILIQLPDQLYREDMKSQGVELPPFGEYGVGMVFLPREEASRMACQEEIQRTIVAEGQILLGWRDVPVEKNMKMSAKVKHLEPVIRQVFVGRGPDVFVTDRFERKLYVIRKKAGHAIQALKLKHGGQFYVSTFSARTICYKGLLLADQIGHYFKDLLDPRCVSAIALVHHRFSTNTFPTWDRAHPFRFIAHNGEINTLRGNVNWLRAREQAISSPVLGEDLKKIWPLIYDGQSDSASFDNALELLVMAGYPLAHAMMMMIPEAWEKHKSMNENRRAFYEYHAALMEPWDGPAAVAFTDGRQIGATLDRNGLRPARYCITSDDLVILASEAGVLKIDESKILQRCKLEPGKMLLLDLDQGRIVSDEEIKDTLARSKPYREWISKIRVNIQDIVVPKVAPAETSTENLESQQIAFGYTQEELLQILKPMAQNAEEPTGSMGNDTALSILSKHNKTFYSYFRQLFAQVTNPPIDPLREDLVMSLNSYIGPKPNLLNVSDINPPIRLEVAQPILDFEDMNKIRYIGDYSNKKFSSYELNICYPVHWGHQGIEARLASLCAEAEDAVRSNANILIISDRRINAENFAIPALLATSAVHQQLVRKGLRTSVGLVVETGSARQVHHFATLASYGAEAVHPYLALKTVGANYHKNFIYALGKGLRKIMSKMGISTYRSYTGAQVFEAIGLQENFVNQYFTGTSSQIEGIGIFEVAEEALRMHRMGYTITCAETRPQLALGGEFAYRAQGEDHMWTPDAIAKLQKATRQNNFSSYQEFAQLINEKDQKSLRGLLKIRYAADAAMAAIPLDEVEAAKDIVKRFNTGAMSLGSISTETHANLAIAMNRLGGKSNTGEGGEDPKRYKVVEQAQTLSQFLGADRVVADLPLQAGDSLRSAIKQVASGRFGVTVEYLTHADQIQIKIAQGAKPGEGGQLPGHKVSDYIAYLRHSTPGVGLISPPPHHDIYSIEDLAQLIYDLRNVNPEASISVKLVAEGGVGTVAAGVAKCKADHIVVSGHDGGTGASPLSSIYNAGLPWELGLAETQQTLTLNNLRSRVKLQVDGQLKTGRDVVIGALLGADEFGFATAPLITQGCIMMRKCHLNTCPVGVATQDPELRKKFTGRPEFLINYFFFIAEEVRQIMAKMGIRKFDQLIGQTEYLEVSKHFDVTNQTGVSGYDNQWKTSGLDFEAFLAKIEGSSGFRGGETKPVDLDHVLDKKLIQLVKGAVVQGEFAIKNTDRSVGAMLSGYLARQTSPAKDSFYFQFTGTAGQSFGAFLAKGVSFTLLGEANDYVGKGLSGGNLTIRPNKDFSGMSFENILIGNTALYGATAGKAFFSGIAGERFAVRNSGATAVIEGVGDHGCEYMTGGLVVVLGKTGRNFAAGMSGGYGYVWDVNQNFKSRCNLEMVEVVTPESEDEALLQKLINEFYLATQSVRAQSILQDWANQKQYFQKIFPKDLKVAKQAAAKQNSRSQGQGRQSADKDSVAKDLSAKQLNSSSSAPKKTWEAPRLTEVYQAVSERVTHQREFTLAPTPEQLQSQAGRCMNCGTPFCSSRCPVHNVIPDWNDLVKNNKWFEAHQSLHSTNNFPEFTGRVCPAPCEAACTLKIGYESVTIKSIECAIVERAWQEGWITPQLPKRQSGQSVAIVGSGPAGLACAQQLARKGHRVVVFEREEKPGGLLRYGIPSFKLEKHILDRRLEQMKAEGVEFVTGANINSVQDLTSKFTAVVLALGAERPNDLVVKGRELTGIHFAMEYLHPSDISTTLSAKGKHVVVIGGGDTGSDCMGTAHRQGALSVTQLEILSKPPMKENISETWPDWPLKLRTSTSHEEGGQREWAVRTVAFVPADVPAASNSGAHANGKAYPMDTQTDVHKVGGVVVEKVEFVNGKMSPIEGTQTTIPADLVFLAMGFAKPGRNQKIDLGLPPTELTARNEYSTALENVFLAGDFRRGQSLIVWAIAEGRHCAEAVHSYLNSNLNSSLRIC